jgi:hypothetical protein
LAAACFLERIERARRHRLAALYRSGQRGCPDRPEESAVIVRAVAGGLEVIVNEFVCARMQRQIPRLLAGISLGALIIALGLRKSADDTSCR